MSARTVLERRVYEKEIETPSQRTKGLLCGGSDNHGIYNPSLVLDKVGVVMFVLGSGSWLLTGADPADLKFFNERQRVATPTMNTSDPQYHPVERLNTSCEKAHGWSGLATSTCSMPGRSFLADSSKGKVLVRFIPRASDYRMNERTDTFTATNSQADRPQGSV